MEIFEIKPSVPSSADAGRKQVKGYVDAVNKNKKKNGKYTAVKGYSFNPKLLTLPNPFNTRKAFRYKLKENGLIVYWQVNNPIKTKATAKQKKTANEINRKVKATGAVVATGATGYLIYRGIRLAASIVVPATIPINLVLP